MLPKESMELNLSKVWSCSSGSHSRKVVEIPKIFVSTNWRQSPIFLLTLPLMLCWYFLQYMFTSLVGLDCYGQTCSEFGQSSREIYRLAHRTGFFDRYSTRNRKKEGQRVITWEKACSQFTLLGSKLVSRRIYFKFLHFMTRYHEPFSNL